MVSLDEHMFGICRHMSNFNSKKNKCSDFAEFERKMAKKIYVGVNAFFNENGQIEPLSIQWYNGRTLRIKRIEKKSFEFGQNPGDSGLCYLCVIGERTVRLFFEDPAWFIEL